MMELRRIFWGAGVSVLVIGAGSFAVGRLSNSEALGMLSAMLPSTRFLCSSVITSTSTILALILTLISFTHQSERSLRPEYYDQIKLIAKFSCGAFISAIVLLLFVNLPLEKSPDNLIIWYRIIYYFLLVYTSLLGGLLIAIMLMLYHVATSVILVVNPSANCDSIIAEEEGR